MIPVNWVIFCESGESCEFGKSSDAGDTGDAGRFLLIWWGCCYIKIIDSLTATICTSFLHINSKLKIIGKIQV